VTLLAPSALWLLLSLPLIVVLFLVRQRKREQVVSALFLWAEAQAAARRRRRISPTLLLLVQLLFAALVALALAQPRFSVAGTPPRVLVIDASASMAALEEEGTRLAQAVAEARTLLRGAGEVAVVRAGLGARVVQPLSGDHARVREALTALEAADAEAAVGEALSLARTLAPDAELHLFSDQAAPPGFAEVVKHAVGQAAPNVGISAFEIAYGQLFVSLVSSAPYPQEVTLIASEGENELRNTLLVPAEGQANTSVPVASAGGLYRARLEGIREDALALDNLAFAGNRTLNVRTLGTTPALARALAALPGTTSTRGSPDTGADTGVDTAGGGADVTVSVGSARLPPGNAVVFAPREAEPVYTEVADWVRSDPALRFADLTGVVVAPSTAPLPLPLERAEVLAQTADLTPVLLRWRDAGRVVVYFRFHPSQSDLARRPAFPIVLANILEGFRSEALVPLGTALGPGRWLTEPGRAVVDAGEGDGMGARNGAGVGGRTYTSAPLPATESRLAVTATPEPAQETVAAGESDATRTLSLGLVALALALLVAEWLLWSRGRLGPVLGASRRSSAGR